MKPKASLRSFLFATGSTLLAVSSAQAATFYWDNNGTATGFGNAGGQWAQDSTSGGTSARWKTDVNGTAAGSATQATTNADIFNFGTATSGLGAGTITVSGSVTMGDTFYGAASGAVVLSGGTINFGAAKTITVNNTTNTINSIIGGAATSLTKAGAGTLVTTGVNSYTGTTIINAGTLNLGGGTANGSLASTVLTLGGGSFSYTRTGTNTQGFTTTNIGGNSVITGASGNTLNLGTVTRTGTGNRFHNFGGTGLALVSAASASNDATGIMAGFTVGNSWAVANGTGVAISGLADGSYTLSSVAGTTGTNYTGTNIDVDSSEGTLDAGITANSLRFSAAAANTLSITGANVVTTGGILVGSGVDANLSTISGGTLTGAASKDLVIIQNNAAGGLTISSNIINNTSTSLTKSGAGLLTLGGNNTFTGGVVIHGGTLALDSTGALNSTAGSENAVTFGQSSTGTLRLAGNSAVIRSLATDAAAPGTAVVENASGSNATLTIGNSGNASGTFAGIIQNGTGAGTLALTKAGTGTLTLSGANTYTGDTTLNGGTVVITNATSFGGSDVLVTGASRINATGGLSYANAINVGATLDMQLPSTTAATATFSGQLTGSSTINLVGSGSGNNQTNLDFTNTGNTFTGSVVGPAGNVNGADYFRFASIGDGGSFTFNKGGNRGGVIYTGAAAIEFNTRQIAIGTSFGGASGLNGNGIPQNSFANNATDSAHTVTFINDLSVGAIASSSVFFFDGSNTGDNTFAGDIGDASSTNTLGIGKWGAGKWILTGSNSFEGNTFITNGTLSVNTIDVAANNQSLGKGSLINFGYNATNGTLEFTGSTNSTTDKRIVIGNANNNHAGGAIILNNGDGTMSFSNATFNSLPGTVTTVDRTLTLGGTNTGANTISGTIQDNVTGAAQISLTKNDTGKWVLGGNNSYTGGTTLAINGGILAISHANALGTGTVHNATTNSATSASTLQLDFAVPGAGPGSSAADPNVIANNFTFSSQNLLASAGFANIQNVSGFNRIGGSLTISGTGGSGANIISDAGHLELAGSLTTNQTGTRAFNLGGAGNGTVSGIISNGTATVPVTKSGAGTWTLSNDNSYTGATNVNEGTLLINGSTSTTSVVTVAPGATLGGNGVVGGATTVNGNLKPGTSPGLLEFGAALTLGGTATTTMEINGLTRETEFDGVDVTGLLTYGGALVFDFGTTFGTSQTWNLFDSGTVAESFSTVALGGEYTGSLDNIGSGVWELTSGDNTWTFTESDGVLGLSVIPEPSSALLGALGALLLLRRRR